MAGSDEGATADAAGEVDKTERDGWTKRSVLDEPRLSEVVESYRALGYEVRTVDIDPDTMNGCTACLEGNPGAYKIIYTRAGPKTGPDLFDELFD